MMSSKTNTVAFWSPGALLAVLLVLGGSLFFAWSAFTSWVGTGDRNDFITTTQTGCRTKVTGGHVEFELVYGRDATGIDLFTVSDTDGKQLWVLSGPGQTKLPKLVYGEVPADGERKWKQDFPESGKAPEDIRGKRVKVRIDSRYNIPLGPGTAKFEVEIDVPQQ